jgi:ATP phosphoribosyltransferase regulatory subunit
LLTGTGEALDLQTFKLVDQLSGRMMGLRADSTPQVARIDAHLLESQGCNAFVLLRAGVAYAPCRPHATREPLQFGAEIYGHAGLEADLETLLLALDCLKAANVQDASVDLADARIVNSVLPACRSMPTFAAAHAHFLLWPPRTPVNLAFLSKAFPSGNATGPAGAGAAVWRRKGACWRLKKHSSPRLACVSAIKFEVAGQSPGRRPKSRLIWPICEGYAYYSGARFAVYAPGAADALARGGRYDEVGAVFGRNRPAAGVQSGRESSWWAWWSPRPLQAAIRAPWSEAGRPAPGDCLATQPRRNRVCVLPGHESEVDEFHCDRELIQAGQWVVQAI